MSRSTGSDRPSERTRYEAEVAAYVAAGGNEEVQRVITAVHGMSRRLSQWYTRQLTDVGLSSGEWAVISILATSPEGTFDTPSSLAHSTAVAPSSMTHRLDRMSERGLVDRTPDTANRTRILITLTAAGWELFQQVIRHSDVMESDVLDRLDPPQRQKLASLLEQAITGLDDALDGP
ncbi:MarR family winged helix-turn-helix transcriptional regulator [Dermatophilaceae bacterium Sec6.4]